MYFHSLKFVLIFLPLVLAGFLLLERITRSLDARWAWLVVASLVFYGSWNPSLVALLAASVAFNFAAGLLIAGRAGHARRAATIGAVAVDLGLLGHFKYVDFFVANLAALGPRLPFLHVALSLGISFYTFQ